MEQQSDSVRKTFKYKLLPTPEQERMLETVVWRCRELSNAGLEERKAAWERCGVSVTFAMQSAQLPAIKEVRQEYNDINAQVLQDVLHRLDKAFAACFRRVTAGAHPRLSVLWLGAGPRRERGATYLSGRAGPSGTNVIGCGERCLSGSRRELWGACQ
jgi:hypothetical protein